jgi:hypothetical protein
MDCHEPHPAPNEKTQPIQWTERPTGALVAVNSLWPRLDYMGWSPLTPGDLVFGDFSALGYKKIGKITELSKPQNWLKDVLKKKLLLTPATSQNGKNKSLRLWPNSPNTGFL